VQQDRAEAAEGVELGRGRAHVQRRDVVEQVHRRAEVRPRARAAVEEVGVDEQVEQGRRALQRAATSPYRAAAAQVVGCRPRQAATEQRAERDDVGAQLLVGVHLVCVDATGDQRRGLVGDVPLQHAGVGRVEAGQQRAHVADETSHGRHEGV
jgi:hypothetical protein